MVGCAGLGAIDMPQCSVEEVFSTKRDGIHGVRTSLVKKVGNCW